MGNKYSLIICILYFCLNKCYSLHGFNGCVCSEIGSCVSLRILTVQNNSLRNIPAEIGNLHNLTVLSLTKNRLRNLPMSVLKLRNLKALWLVYNQSKPLTPLVREYDPHSSALVLTCYLLPQASSSSHSGNLY